MRRITGKYARRRAGSDRGFTLIELLVVIGITGVLAAIAVPQFAWYRAGGFDARAEIMLRNVATAEEAYFVDFTVYKDCSETDCHSFLSGIQPIESGITLQITTTTSGFTGTATHRQGSGEIFTWN